MNLIDIAYQWVAINATSIGITIAIVVAYLVLDRFSTPKLEEGADQGGFKEGSATHAIRIARMFAGFIGFLVMALTWGIEYDSVFLFASTTLTLLGVALFASWSLLSNVTAYFVILLHPSFRRGTFVRVIDFDNYAEGYISELSLFNTKLVTESREVIIYPNNLLLGRPALINPRDRLYGVGKLPIHADIDNSPE
tara:strand:- start:697 stop:1281 length:585 start_codon:yes stop_codon:yes gene_type:complete